MLSVTSWSSTICYPLLCLTSPRNIADHFPKVATPHTCGHPVEHHQSLQSSDPSQRELVKGTPMGCKPDAAVGPVLWGTGGPPPVGARDIKACPCRALWEQSSRAPFCFLAPVPQCQYRGKLVETMTCLGLTRRRRRKWERGARKIQVKREGGGTLP